MELNQIKDLLGKYYDGATSPEEEQILKNFFRKNDVPDELAVDKELFVSLSEAKVVNVPNPELERKIAGFIDAQEKKEWKQRFVRSGYKIATIAASIAVLIVCYLFIYQEQHELKLKDSYKDPQLAYAEVKRTLYYISERLNKGTEPLKNVSKMDQGVSQLSSFSSFGSGLKELELVSKYYDDSKIENNKK